MDHVRCARELWAAWSGGDYETVEAAFATTRAGARSRRALGLREPNRNRQRDALRQNRERRVAPAGEVEQVTSVGDRAVVGFRPEQPDPDARPLDDGLGYVIVRYVDGLVTEMKGCASREGVLEYAET